MIFDCFLYRNELDLLRLRLATLMDVVDVFVLVESAHTFRGVSKPYHFHDWVRNVGVDPDDVDDPIARAWHKVRVVHVADSPPNMTAWAREDFQRDALARGVYHVQGDIVREVPGALVLFSDVDEIPTPEAVRLADDILPSWGAGLERPQWVGFKQREHLYGFNFVREGFHMVGTRAMRAGALDRMRPCALRKLTQGLHHYITDGGVHLSWFPSPYRLSGVAPSEWRAARIAQDAIDKVAAFSHAELDNRPELGITHLTQAIEQGVPWWGGEPCARIADDDPRIPVPTCAMNLRERLRYFFVPITHAR